jgi:Protein of unknown function (DUF2591)
VFLFWNKEMSNSKFNAAFIAAYGTNVGGADTKTIERFNELIDADVDADLIQKEIGSDYTSLMDALGMFNDGVVYGSTQLFEKVPPEYLALADSLQGMIEVFGDSFGDGESETVDVARQALVAIGYVHPSVRNNHSQEVQPKFKTVKLADLEEIELDWLVAIARGWSGDVWLFKEERNHKTDGSGNFLHRYSSNCSQGGQIMDQEFIDTEYMPGDAVWKAKASLQDDPCEQYGKTRLMAAVRCFIAGKHGDEVEIPVELA